jgi:hypothetical protein
MGTFHARGRSQGRSCVFAGDLPCWRLISWKGGTLFRGTFDARDNTHERARGERANLAGWRRNPKKEQGRDEKHFCISKIFIIFVIRTNPCKDENTNSGDYRATG